MPLASSRLGVRAKLIALFLAIKVIPLILLALLAWEGVTGLGRNVAALADRWSSEGFAYRRAEIRSSDANDMIGHDVLHVMRTAKLSCWLVSVC